MPALSGTACGKLASRAGEAHLRLGRHAVVAALELQDHVAAGEGVCEPHGIHVGFAARGEEAHLLSAGDGPADLLGRSTAAALLAKKVMPFGNCSITASSTSGWPWPSSIGPEPMR